MMTYGMMVDSCVKGGEEVEKEGMKVEVMEVGRMRGMDMDRVIGWVKKRNGGIVVEEGEKRGGVAG
ncbi:transketolase C-terminal domain-containing protein, partial [Paenibacillus xylanexedens]|uniref:transketolase C-terminal domain-containing protein n=1 Tax=Paenibacillus xylanexedens TaxID=528191 RepID=UPI0028CB37F4